VGNGAHGGQEQAAAPREHRGQPVDADNTRTGQPPLRLPDPPPARWHPDPAALASDHAASTGHWTRPAAGVLLRASPRARIARDRDLGSGMSMAARWRGITGSCGMWNCGGTPTTTVII